MAVSESKKRLAMSVLKNTYGTPAKAKEGLDEAKAVGYAATLLAASARVAYGTAEKLVREWFATETPA